MSTLPNSSVDSNSFSPAGLPDDLSPAAYAQFEQENNAWHDDRRALEAENQSDYFQMIARLRRQNDELAALTTRANAERDALDVEIKAHAAAMRLVSEKLTMALT